MASLLTDSQKTEIQAALSEVHDTFKRDIFVYIEEQVSTRPSVSSYNPIYGRAKDSARSTSQIELVKHTVEARVRYAVSQDDYLASAKGQFNIKLSQGEVRIKVDLDGYNKVRKSSRIEIDDELFVVDSDSKNVGPFDTQFYTVILKRDE